MKQIYRCEFCNETGTGEEIAKHEIFCSCNPHQQRCGSCLHKEHKVTLCNLRNCFVMETDTCDKWWCK